MYTCRCNIKYIHTVVADNLGLLVCAMATIDYFWLCQPSCELRQHYFGVWDLVVVLQRALEGRAAGKNKLN